MADRVSLSSKFHVVPKRLLPGEVGDSKQVFLLFPQEKDKKEDDANEFVSAVCWRTVRDLWCSLVTDTRELMKNSRGWWQQRRQNIKTNYTRQKVHVNIWNKTNIHAILLSQRRQLHHFHVVIKTWSIFQQLSSIFSFRKTRWRQLNFSENRNKHCNQSKYMLKNTRIMSKYFFCLPTSPSSNDFLKRGGTL